MCVEQNSSVLVGGGEDINEPCDKCAVRAPMSPDPMSHHHHHQNSPVPGGTTGRQRRSTQDDFERLSTAVSTLNTSGWYHGAMDFTEARQKLRQCENGTFLVRDSSNPNYLYTVSVQTPRGTTSVRIEYEYGKFMLDSEKALRRLAPSYDCVVKLLQHYVKMTALESEGSGGHMDRSKHRPAGQEVGNSSNNNSGRLMWLEPSGRKDTAARIVKPLRSHAPSLQHICRLTINRHVQPLHQDKLELPGRLKTYLKQYPFDQ